MFNRMRVLCLQCFKMCGCITVVNTVMVNMYFFLLLHIDFGIKINSKKNSMTLALRCTQQN